MKINETTHIGARDSNQDYYTHVCDSDWACFIVADGLGGHEGGDIASKFFCEAVIALAPEYSEDILQSPVAGLEALLHEAHEDFIERLQAEHGAMDAQTTLAMAWLDEQHLISAHVGDSRIYRINSSQVTWRTPDHTVVQKYFEEGKINKDEMNDHPLQNRLLRSINRHEPIEADIFVHPPLQTHETLLLCTDGFWTHLSEEAMVELVHSNSIKTKLPPLIQQIASEPDSDNITVQIVQNR